MDADVLIVGAAGPTGLMLAGELGLAGVGPVVLEREPRLRETSKANGFNGQMGIGAGIRRGHDRRGSALCCASWRQATSDRS